MSRRSTRLLVGTLSLLTFATAEAQRPAPQPAGPKTIVGVVVDTSDASLDSVRIIVRSRNRDAYTDSTGAFRLDDIKPGEYQVNARKIGFYPQTKTIVVGDNGGTVTFALVPFVHWLPAVVTSTPRGGLSGVVGDTAYNALGSSEVWVIGGAHVKSDSTGAFFVDLKPGRYMVRIAHQGYAAKMVSVSVPNDSGRRIQALLVPSRRGMSHREAWALSEMESRLLRRDPVWSNFVSREDLAGKRMKLEEYVSSLAHRRMDGSCNAVIDAGPFTEPLWAIDLQDVESIELYIRQPPRQAVRSIMGNRQIRDAGSAANSPCPASVFVWLRK